MPPDWENIRHEMIRLARRGKKYRGKDDPNRWLPGTVLNPETGLPFSDQSAWELIADLLETGHEFVAKPQNLPKNTIIAYEITFPLAEHILYIKIRLGSGFLFGRSFHYSDRQEGHA